MAEQDRRAAWTVVVGAAAVVAVLALAAVLLVGALLEDDTVGAAAPVTDVDEGEVPQPVYAAVELGIDKDALDQALLPARPVDSRVVDRYQLRSPETVAASCVYYEAAEGLADDLYRFCFVEDALVEKTVIFPDEPGLAG